jgi:hypothetical protein
MQITDIRRTSVIAKKGLSERPTDLSTKHEAGFAEIGLLHR